MPKFKVKVKLTAAYEYELEIDHASENKAQQEAANKWRDQLPDDFQVSKDYITDWDIESEQQTAICPDCGIEHGIPTATVSEAQADAWLEDYEYCKPCGAKIDAEDRANGR
jgi:hypothetical protein